mmetsp:Transcript_28758/g.57921  ORF Transcript_28758/g.57921 Transcript_28758/m.57921 type:complete len:132 (+) Transcript_28758:115-510(+)
MVKLQAGNITNTVHSPHAAKVILAGVIMDAWAPKRLVAESGTSIGVLANVSKTARKVRAALVEAWYPAHGFSRIQARLPAALRTCHLRALQNANTITDIIAVLLLLSCIRIQRSISVFVNLSYFSVISSPF